MQKMITAETNQEDLRSKASQLNKKLYQNKQNKNKRAELYIKGNSLNQKLKTQKDYLILKKFKQQTQSIGNETTIARPESKAKLLDGLGLNFR